MQIVVIGDKSRYHFFRAMVESNQKDQKLFFTEVLGSKDIYLTSNIDDVKDDVYYSSKLPLNTILFFPQEYENILNKYNNGDKILKFDEFPYATDEDMQQFKDVINRGNYGQLQIVLLDNKRKGLHSDISTSELALDEAKKRYESNGIPVCIYSIGQIPMFLLWNEIEKKECKERVYRSIMYSVKKQLKTFDSVYSLKVGSPSLANLISMDVLSSFFKYDKKINGVNLCDVCRRRSYNLYWNTNIIVNEFYRTLYKKAISDLCVWNLKDDIKDLDEHIRKAYLKEFSSLPSLVFNDKEENYELFLNRNREKILIYKSRIVEFFNSGLKVILKERINDKIIKMEELLK